MSSVVVSGDTSGAITISAPAISGTNTLTLPAVTDTLVGLAATQTLTNKTVTAPVLSGSVTGTYTLAGTPTMGASLVTAGTAVASTSGTSIDFTSIPSWAKRVTVMFSGVSTSGTSLPMIQLGDSGGIETTGYTAGSSLLAPASIGTSNYTTGFTFRTDALASIVMDGFITINLVSSSTNTWVAGGTIYAPTPSAYMAAVAGAKSLSATLDRVRLTTVGGSDTFDAGSVNILYE